MVDGGPRKPVLEPRDSGPLIVAPDEIEDHIDPEDVGATTANLAGAELDRLLALTTRAREQLPTQPYDDAAVEIVRNQSAPPPAPVPAEPVPVPVPVPDSPSPLPEPAAPPPVAASPPVAVFTPPAAAPAPPPEPPRIALPSLPADWPAAPDRSRRIITIATLLGALVAIPLLYSAFSSDDPPPDPAPSATALPPPPPPPPATASSPPPPSAAETEAIVALGKLREGIGECVRHGIGTIPGTSPPIPSSLKLAAGSGYATVPADWKTAVWACTKFHQIGSMRFQIQWQLVKAGAEGVGLAWVDLDGDGKADRAFSFRATVPSKGEVTLGDVGPTDPSRPVLVTR